MPKEDQRAIDWSSALNMRMTCHVFVDFDGTISPLDTTDLLLDRFADPHWRNIEDEWTAGRIGSRECMGRQIELVRASPEQLEAFVASIEIDPGFPGFVRQCRELGHRVTVVSDGVDLTVGAVLRRAGLDLPFHANTLEWVGGGRWRLSFPHANSRCLFLAGNCKCQFAATERRMARIVIGDGRSDFCLASWADLVLAKGALAAHCLRRSLPHFAFNDFTEVNELLAHWLAGRRQGTIAPAAYLGEP
jgi:2-hydroxy-3-keto-5-methylthiopentenyl-1-phosphate phosphatase